MTDTILITTFDKQRLMRLMPLLERDIADREDYAALREELDRATEVDPRHVPANVVTMNSTVRVTDVRRGVASEFTIVFPGEANYDRGRISVLAPLGTALLGARTGDVVDWTLPGGSRQLRVDRVVYQPEADGRFDL